MSPDQQPTVDGERRWVAGRSAGTSDVAEEPVGVLVGRERELATVMAAMTAARRGVARVVHLVGEAGIGKTTLAEHASALASGQGWTVVWGRAWGTGATIPYWLWQQVLGSLVPTTNLSTRVRPATI